MGMKRGGVNGRIGRSVAGFFSARGLGFLFVSGNSISIMRIDRIFCNFDRLGEKKDQNVDYTCRRVRTDTTKNNICSVTKGNSAKLGITISEEVTWS